MRHDGGYTDPWDEPSPLCQALWFSLSGGNSRDADRPDTSNSQNASGELAEGKSTQNPIMAIASWTSSASITGMPLDAPSVLLFCCKRFWDMVAVEKDCSRFHKMPTFFEVYQVAFFLAYVSAPPSFNTAWWDFEWRS